MEPTAILNHEDMMFSTRVHTAGERGHHPLVGVFVERWHQPESAFSRFWANESIDVEPLIAWVDGTGQRLTGGCPDLSANRFEADAVFVHCPQRDTGVEKLRSAKLLH